MNNGIIVSPHPSVGETQWGPVNKGLRALPYLHPLTSRYNGKRRWLMSWYGMVMEWNDDNDGMMTDGFNGMV